MTFRLLHGHRPHLFRHQARQPFVIAMRRVPMHSGRSPTVAASTRLARSGSSKYAEQTSVWKRLAIKATTFISVSAGCPPPPQGWRSPPE